MNIAVFGAAFDPPHHGHYQITLELLRQKIADQVWLLPVKYHEFGKNMSPDSMRLAMLKLMVDELNLDLRKHEGDLSQVKIETYELDQAQPSCTYLTLGNFRKMYPEHNFSFVIGADNLMRFAEWDHYRELLDEFRFYVYPRSGYNHQQLMPGMKLIEGVEKIGVSSTQVRQAVAGGANTEGQILDKVRQYIETNQLYV